MKTKRNTKRKKLPILCRLCLKNPVNNRDEMLCAKCERLIEHTSAYIVTTDCVAFNSKGLPMPGDCTIQWGTKPQ